MIEKANFLQRGFILVLLTCTCMVLADYVHNDVSCPKKISCPSIKAPGSDDVIQLVKKKVPRDHPLAIRPQMKGIDLNIVCSIPACLSNPCLHGGTCNETSDGYECHCLFSFTGKRCQDSTSSLADRPVPPADSTPHCPKLTTFTELTSTQDDATTTTDSTTTLSTTAANPESTSTQDDTTTTTTTTLSTTAAESESTSTQDDTTTTTTTLSTTAAESESTSTQDNTTTTTTTTLSTTAAESESTSTQDDTTTTTTTLSTTAAESESTSTQDDTTTTTTTTLSTTAAESESTSTQDDTTTTTTTVSTNAADSVSDGEITTEGSTYPQFSPAPPGWKCTSSKCYRMYSEQLRNWSDARTFCSELDPVNTPYGYRSPSLLFLNTEEEARKIEALQLGLAAWMWINCNDQSTEGDFVCDVDGNGTPSSSFWWKDGQPNDIRQQDCVAVKRSELLKWNDVQCSRNGYTMCQFIVGQPEQ